MDPNQTTDAPAPSTAPTPVTVEEMLASLASEDGASEGGNDPAPVEAPADPTAEVEEGEEAAEGEAKAEPEAPKTETEKTKLSRNQRLKAARDAAMAEVVAEKKNATQALSVANYWRTEAHARDALLQHVLRETGFHIDPRDAALLDVRRQETRRQFEAQTQQEVAKIDQTHAETLQRRALADDYSVQAQSLAKKTGVEPVQILQAFALAEQQKFGLTMEQVAQQLSAVGRKSTPPAAAQLAANRSAPKPVRGGRVPAPDFDTSIDGMLSFLDSRPKAGKR